MPPKKLREMVLTVKVMPSRPHLANLSALVESLVRADYTLHEEAGLKEKEIQIDVELFIPPKDQFNALEKENQDAYQDAMNRLRKEWTQGEVHIVQIGRDELAIRGDASTEANNGDLAIGDAPEAAVADVVGDSSPGSVDLMLSAWDAKSDTEAAIFIDHSQVLSTQWMRWVRHALAIHHAQADNFEPRMFGVVLERADAIITSKKASRDDRSSVGQQPFHYQNVGYHANLFLPQYWRRFMSWVGFHRALMLHVRGELTFSAAGGQVEEGQSNQNANVRRA